MAVTVDFGTCAQCGEKNSTAATKCRNCGAVLWGVKTKGKAAPSITNAPQIVNPPTLPNGRTPLPPPATIDKSVSNRNFGAIGVQLFGGLIFLIGVFLFAGNVLGFFPTFPGAGWLGLIIGGGVWRAGAAMD